MFKETQKFGLWLVLLLIFTSGLPMLLILGIGIYKQIFKGEPFGNNPMSDNGLLITFSVSVLLFLVLILLFTKARLYTEINRSVIRFRFFPFHIYIREISWELVEKFEVKKYDPIRDYGGWGIRFRKNRKAYIVSGNNGLELQLKSGKTILIGTQKDQELEMFLNDKIKK